MRVAITGGIGTGKSSFLKALTTYLPTYTFYSFDDGVHALYEREDVKRLLLKTLGTSDRKTISDIVFDNPVDLIRLETMFFPFIQDMIEDWTSERNVVVEFPLLFEKGFDKHFSFIVAVVCDTDVRIERVQKRNGFSVEKIKSIMSTQLPSNSTYFTEVADVLINTTNNPDLDLFAKNVAWRVAGLKPRHAKRGIVAGSFDPITEGHLWLIEKALSVVDVVDIVIGINPSKKGLFDPEQRADLVKRSMLERKIDESLWQVNVLPKDKLLIKYAEETDASFVFRGIRNVTDFDYEAQINIVQRKVCPGIETIFLMPPAHLTEVSSSLVKSLLYLEGWENIVTQYVSRPVLQGLREKQAGV